MAILESGKAVNSDGLSDLQKVARYLVSKADGPARRGCLSGGGLGACLLSSSPTKRQRELFGSPSGEMALQLPRDPVQGSFGSRPEMALEKSSVSYTGQPG